MTDTVLMALYSITLAISAGCFGYALGRWLGERSGRREAMVEEAFWRAMEDRQHAEARGRIVLWSPPFGSGPN
jgi:hypothetical protein